MSRVTVGLARGRRASERLMIDACTVTRIQTHPNGEPVTTTVAGKVTPVVDEIYKGKVKQQSYEGYEQTPEAGGKTFTVQRTSLHFPVGSFVMEVGDVATITDAHDGLLIGRQYRMVQVAPYKTLATAYRVFVDEEPS